MTATRVLSLCLAATAAAYLTTESGSAAGPGATPVSAVRLKTIAARATAKGTALTIEATEPVPYLATRPDALTVLLDLRNVTTDGVSNKVATSAESPILGVLVEPDVIGVMGSPVSRLRVGLKHAVAHRVRSERNTIVVEFDKASNDLATYLTAPAVLATPGAVLVPAVARPEPRPDAMQALVAFVAPSPVRPGQPLPAIPLLALAPASLAQNQAPNPAQATQDRRYVGTPVSFDFEDADLIAVLKLFQQVSGLNMVIDPTIQGKVTLVLKDIPWDQALDVVLKANKLGFIVDDSIVRIAPLNVLSDEQSQRRKLADEQALAGDLKVMTKILSYAVASDTQALIKGLLSQRGAVIVDSRTNMLIITDLQDRLDTVASLLTSLDRAQPQVEIEARIVQTNKTYAKALGVTWGFTGRIDPALGNTTSLAFPNSIGVGGRTGGSTNGAATAVNLPAPGASSAAGLSLGSVNGAFNLDVALTALENSGNGRLLSTPKVSTLNNVEAEIAQGVQVPYQTTANNTVTTNFKDAALTLKVLPQITEAGTVIMKISVDKGSVGPVFGGVPSINTQRANTTVLVNDGETTVIGGIFEGNERTSHDNTPGLSKLPGLGWLFKRDSTSEDNTELLIFITPRIIR